MFLSVAKTHRGQKTRLLKEANKLMNDNVEEVAEECQDVSLLFGFGYE